MIVPRLVFRSNPPYQCKGAAADQPAMAKVGDRRGEKSMIGGYMQGYPPLFCCAGLADSSL